MNILRVLIPISGAITMISGLASGILLFGGISDGFFYHNVHTKTRSIAATISNYKSNNGVYPDDMLIKSWSTKLNLFPSPSVSSPSENRYVDDPNKIKIPTGSFTLAYWDGDEFEFYYPWDDSFTTSTLKHVGTALLISICFAAMALAFHKFRSVLQNANEPCRPNL